MQVDIASTVMHQTIEDSVDSAILGTLQMRFKLPSGALSAALRGFCDPGSQVNLVTERCVQLYGIQRTKGKIPITGIGAGATASGFVKLSLFHRARPSYVCDAKFLVVRNITRRLPDRGFSIPFNDALSPDELADDTMNVPGDIDVLIGAGTWAHIVNSEIMRTGGEEQVMIAQSTAFGWVVSGQAVACNHIRLLSCHVAVESNDIRLDKILLDFWKADSLPEERGWSADEQLAEHIFQTTHSREKSGRYVVRIPLKRDHAELGVSRNVAKARFHAIERKFAQNNELFLLYKAVFDDYRSKRQMVLAPDVATNDRSVYYLSHHPINVPSRTCADGSGKKRKGKFRVVFDPSVPTSNGVSFNDLQLAGPKLHADLIEIFLRFRMDRFALTADIVQMFRQINVDPLDWNYQRVFWRDSPDMPLSEYIITCVTWGMTSAGFNAVRALRQCALDSQSHFPIGADVVLNRFYCDDMMAGAPDEQTLARVYEQVHDLLATGGFQLTKWTTNNGRLASLIRQSKQAEVEFSTESSVLGMRWVPDGDTLCFKVDSSICDIPDGALTKRIVISAMSRVYDPNGLVAPVIVGSKILQQDLWRSGKGWDEKIPANLLPQWREFKQNVGAISEISVPRWVGTGPSKRLQLHIFSDASEKAMGAVAFIRVIHEDGQISANLITSKSKVWSALF